MSVRKDLEQYMAGMTRAYQVAKENNGDIEAIAKEVKMRGFYKIPITVSVGQTEQFVQEICDNVYNTMLADVGTTLNIDFGFGKDRLNRFKEAYDKRAYQTMDMNWIGNHYVTLTDYAKEINDKCDWNINTDVTDKCQNRADLSNPNYKMVKLERLVAELSSHGFGEAADWILREWKDY